MRKYLLPSCLAIAALFTMALAPTAIAGKKPLAKVMEAKAESTANQPPGANEGSGDYSGRVHFTKVSPMFNTDRVNGKMTSKARKSCLAKFAGGTTSEGTPYVMLTQRPNSQINFYYRKTVIEPSGKWTQFGFSPYQYDSSNPIDVVGGFFDEYQNYYANFTPAKFHYKHKKRTVNCRAFHAVIYPR